MALYHFSVKQVSRGKGQTVVNSAAYISGQKLYNDSADELLDGKEGKATETKLERGAKLIRELLADKKEISIRELDEKAKEQGISGRTMRDVRSRMKNELEYQVNEKQENSIRLKE